MSYSINLSNGTTLSGLKISGTCFVSKSAVSEQTFIGGLDRVSISGSAAEGEQMCPYELGEHRGMELGGVFKLDGEWYFWLTEPNAEELAMLKVQADVEYLAMMSGVEL